MQELANSDASESTLITSGGREGIRALLQSFCKELTGPDDISEGLGSRLDHFMLPQDDNTLVPVK